MYRFFVQEKDVSYFVRLEHEILPCKSKEPNHPIRRFPTNPLMICRKAMSEIKLSKEFGNAIIG